MLPVKKLPPFAGAAGKGGKISLLLKMIIRGVFPLFLFNIRVQNK